MEILEIISLIMAIIYGAMGGIHVKDLIFKQEGKTDKWLRIGDLFIYILTIFLLLN